MNIKVRNLICLPLCVALLIAAKPVLAQECVTVSETIVPLKRARLGTPTIWSTFYGQDGMESIADVALGGEGTFVVVGSYTKDKEDLVSKPFMAKLDGRGRIVWENRQDVSAHKTFQAIHKRPKGYAAIGDSHQEKKGKGFYLGLYTESGERIREIPVTEAGYELSALSFAPSKSGKSYLIAATREAKGKTEAVVYKITLAGKILWRRQYSPGLANKLHHIHLASDGHYTMVGEMKSDYDRMAGWIVRIDYNGALVWQKQYPRGRGAALLSAQTNADNSITVSGRVDGAGVKESAAWVMKVSAGGDALWQRYYQGRTHYSAPSLLGHEDGRTSVLIDGIRLHPNDRSHVSLLTLSPRGRLMDVESFSDGQGARGYMIKSGYYGERVVVGHVQNIKPKTEWGDEGAEEEKENIESIPYLYDGWIYAATALEPYDDPCIRKY